MPQEFQNNSQTAKQKPKESVDEEIEKIIDGSARISKPTGMTRLRRSFIAGDASSVGDHVFWNLLIPSAQDAVAEMLSTFVDMMIYGEKRGRVTRPGVPAVGTGSTSRVNYSGVGTVARAAINPAMTQPVVERLDPTRIMVNSRAEAEVVLGKMIEYVDQYGAVTVAQLYRMLGHTPEYTDNKWGWTNLDSADFRRHRHEVRIILPTPQDLN